MAKYYTVLLIILLLIITNATNLIASNLTDSKIDYSMITSAIRQYEKAEWNIKLKAEWTDPYLYTDISLDMIITSPSGKELILPCYYESGNSGEISNWKAKFAPRETGQYSYYFRLEQKGKQTLISSVSNFSSAASNKKGFLHRNDNWTFRFDNGETFRGIGENICWEARSNDDSKFFKELHENPRFNYEYLLTTLAKNGGNYFRTWICAWNLPLEWKKVVNTNRYINSDAHFNPSSFEKIDRMLSLSDSLGLYVMMTLDGAGSFGGEMWQNNNYNAINGGPAKSPADFFANLQAKIQYKSKLRYLVARYGYYSSIGAWEFFNEIDNAMYAGKETPQIEPKSIVEWHDEMSKFLKNIDPYDHLVTTSISHRDIDGLNTISNIDFNQKHIYRSTDIIPSVVMLYADKFKKPYVIGEFANQWDWSLNFNDYADDFDYDFKRGLWYGLFSPTPILPMSWWWEFFDNRNMPEYFSRVRNIYNQMMSAGSGNFQQTNVTVNNKDQHVYGLRCGDKNFVYVLNNTQAAVLNDITLNNFNNSLVNIQIYRPDENKYDLCSSFRIENNQLHINGISLGERKDVVLIISQLSSASKNLGQ